MLGMLLALAYAQEIPSETGIVRIYKSDACAHCTPYLEKLLPALDKMGYKNVEMVDFINNQTQRANLARLQQKFNVPLTLQGHMAVDVEGKYLLEGHVPVDVVEKFLAGAGKGYEGAVLVQDSMISDAKSYTFLYNGKAVEIDSSQSPNEYLESGGAKLPSAQVAAGAALASENAGSEKSALDGAADFLPAIIVIVPIVLVGMFLARKV